MEMNAYETSSISKFGLIIIGESGIRYTNQSGGYSCLHPEVEGWYIELPDSDEMNKLMDACDDGSVDDINHLLTSIILLSIFDLRVNEDEDSHEAWRPLKGTLLLPSASLTIHDPNSDINPAPFGDFEAIFTYPNSD